MTNNRNMLKAGVVYTFANIFLKSVSIITAPIFTRLLTTSDYGVVNKKDGVEFYFEVKKI